MINQPPCTHNSICHISFSPPTDRPSVVPVTENVACPAAESLLPLEIISFRRQCCQSSRRRRWRVCIDVLSFVRYSRRQKLGVKMTTDGALRINYVTLDMVIFLLVTFTHLPESVSSRTLPTQMSPYVVETQYGRLRGVLVALPAGLAGRGQSRSKTVIVEAFFGLQYASLLGGELRFMPPTSSMEKWDGVRVALNFRPVCPQRVPDVNRLQRDVPTERVDHIKRLLPFLDKQNEECLNLNIYVPSRGERIYTNNRDSNEQVLALKKSRHKCDIISDTANVFRQRVSNRWYRSRPGP